MSRGARRASVALLAALLTAGLITVGPSAAAAQGSEVLPAGATIQRAGRLEVVAFPSEVALGRSLLENALERDTFPGLPRPSARVRIWLAPDDARFREWVGPGAPEWGAAIAFLREQRIVMQGRNAGADAGDPRQTLRHELAHLALAEGLGEGVPRWFDEGYASVAAGEWGRDEVLATSFGLVWRGVPSLAGLDSGFYGGSERANRTYALAHRAVAELVALGGARGLSLLLGHWREQGSFERALRAAHAMSSADFERRFRSRIRRQYGALALAADLGILATFLGLLLGPAWWQRRRRQRRKLEAMRAADAAQAERERSSALAELLGEAPRELPPPPPD